VRAIPYLIYLFCVAMWVVIWRDVTSIFGVTVNVPALFVLGVALYKEEMTTVWFGFLVGLVMGAAMPAKLGWLAISTAALALAGYHVKERINMDSMWAKVSMVAGGVLIHNIVILLVVQPAGFLTLLWSSALPGTVYTTLVGWLFLLVKEGVVTWKKIKAIF